MLVLGIETSCDETGVALLEFSSPTDVKVISEELASQISLHSEYGGVVPELAAREHMRSLALLCEKVFSDSKMNTSDLDYIGVTTGPGLKGCLLIGVTFAQGISAANSTPVLGINHIESHILTGEMHNRSLTPPYIALVVSGGHTELVLVEKLGKYRILARTRDDAAGEAFDKSANLLGFNYPGGPALAALADTVSSSRFTLPKVAREMNDFSFSGLKTAISLLVKQHCLDIESDNFLKAELAWTIQDAILNSLIHKTAIEMKRYNLPLTVCGGVSANQELRRRLSNLYGTNLHIPPLKHSVDNGAMIAYLAGRRILEGLTSHKTLSILSRWPVESL